MNFSLGALVLIFTDTWTLEGRGEGKGELCVQSGQEILRTAVCYQITFLPVQAL
jgi:hypothetical protein